VQVGEVMPDCEIRLRADGSCEQGGYWIDPVRLHMVLGVDVSPWHERAIIKACQAEHRGPSAADQAADPADGRLWSWILTTRQMMPAMGLILCLRPGEITLPEVAWHLEYDPEQLCDGCVRDTGLRAMVAHDLLQDDRSTVLRATIIVVGRDHKVLAISRPTCHGLLSAVWQEQLMDACCRTDAQEMVGPDIPNFPPVICDASGHEWPMDPRGLQEHLEAYGWREPAQRVADRRRRAGR
jgi:hypothetical protein